jgi:hypothetical protein
MQAIDIVLLPPDQVKDLRIAKKTRQSGYTDIVAASWLLANLAQVVPLEKLFIKHQYN